MVQDSREAIPQGALVSSFLCPVLHSKGEKYIHRLHANCLLQATNSACLLEEHYLPRSFNSLIQVFDGTTAAFISKDTDKGCQMAE